MATEAAPSFEPQVGDENVDHNAVMVQTGSTPQKNVGLPAVLPSPLPEQKKAVLAPSLSAWVASRPGPARAALNVGASEPVLALPVDPRAAGLPSKHGHDSRRGRPRHVSEQSRSRSSSANSRTSTWESHLREDKSIYSDGSTSRGVTPWTSDLTIPNGPTLHTADRAGRTRSRSVSVGSGGSEMGTPKCSRRSRGSWTPTKRASSVPTTPLLFREQMAIDQFVGRITSARTPAESPSRGRNTSRERSRIETPSPARSKMGSGISTPQRGSGPMDRATSAPCTPARTPGSVSVESRLSLLSQRTPSRHWPSSAELFERAMEAKRTELKNLRHLNERTYREALANPSLGVSLRHSGNAHLTLPRAPVLRTEERAARSRSVSRNDTRASSVERGELDVISIPREKQAIERHIGRIESGMANCRGAESFCHQVRTDASNGSRCTTPCAGATIPCVATTDIPANCDHEQWIQDATTARERAERARVVAQAKRQELERNEQTRLCVFRRELAPRTAHKQLRPEPNCAFRSNLPSVDASDPLANTSDAPEPFVNSNNRGEHDFNRERAIDCVDPLAQCQLIEPLAESSDGPEAAEITTAEIPLETEAVVEVHVETAAVEKNEVEEPAMAESACETQVSPVSARLRSMTEEEHGQGVDVLEAAKAVSACLREVLDEAPGGGGAACSHGFAEARDGVYCKQCFGEDDDDNGRRRPDEVPFDTRATEETEALADDVATAEVPSEIHAAVMEQIETAFDGLPSERAEVEGPSGLAEAEVLYEVAEALCDDILPSTDHEQTDIPIAVEAPKVVDAAVHCEVEHERQFMKDGKEQQVDVSEPTLAAEQSCPPSRVTSTPGPQGPRSRLRQPTKFRDAPSLVSKATTAPQGRSRGTAGVLAPSSGAFGSRSPRPCIDR